MLVVAGVLGALVLTVALALFEPWRLFTSSEVDEPAPVSKPVVPAGSETPSSTPESPPAEAQDRVLSMGTFEDAEHDTSGRATVLELADGRWFVRLEGLATSDGPDLHIWLTDQPSGGDWHSYDDGRYVRLGELKATHGNQNYEVPADAELDGLTSVVIWCDRFNVAFGTAPI